MLRLSVISTRQNISVRGFFFHQFTQSLGILCVRCFIWTRWFFKNVLFAVLSQNFERHFHYRYQHEFRGKTYKLDQSRKETGGERKNVGIFKKSIKAGTKGTRELDAKA